MNRVIIISDYDYRSIKSSIRNIRCLLKQMGPSYYTEEIDRYAEKIDNILMEHEGEDHAGS